MAEYSHHNLCVTLEPRYITVTLPCVPRPRRDGVTMPLNVDYACVRRHQWDEQAICMHCHRAIAEVRLRLNPKTSRVIPSTVNPHRTMARLIAEEFDVPPVRFVGMP